MFSRAIVVSLIGRGVLAHQVIAGGDIRRFLRAAAQITFPKAKLGKPSRDTVGVDRGTVVRGAGQGKMFGRQTGGFRSAAFDKRQGLDHLGGRPRQNMRICIAPRADQTCIGVPNRNMSAVDTFENRPSVHLDQCDI